MNNDRFAAKTSQVELGNRPMEDCMVDDCATKPERLYRAVQNIQSIIHHLDEFKSLIGLPCNPTASGVEGSKVPQINLISVLEDSPHKLDSMADEIHQQIDELMGALR